jgi:hypothetical protein
MFYNRKTRNPDVGAGRTARFASQGWLATPITRDAAVPGIGLQFSPGFEHHHSAQFFSSLGIPPPPVPADQCGPESEYLFEHLR